MKTNQYEPHNCPTCGQWIGDDLLAQKKAKKAASQKASIALRKKSGEQVGRERQINYEKIREYRAAGFTIRRIAEIFGCSTSPVQAALKERK